jgi:Periplasmic protease
MRKTLLFVLLAIFSAGLSAQDTPLWLRYSSISPDGNQIAFSYKGDIYKVAVSGGRAMQLTTHSAYDTRPVWSPDGKSIAFASDREGSIDVFIMPAEGGTPKRLTTHSAHEYPMAFRNNNSVLFAANIIRDAVDSDFPSSRLEQVYEVSTSGGRPSLFSSYTMEDVAFNSDGTKLLYHDKKGYEDPWRKHHQSSITRDVWLCDLSGEKSYKKLTTFRGEDRNPVFTTDGAGYYYLSEQDGSFNVYKSSFTTSSPVKVTDFKKNPVRFLTTSKNGTLCFTYDGEIYTVKEGGQPAKVAIQIITDNQENKLKYMNFATGVQEMMLSPNNKEVVFVVRGDIFVASVEYGTTRRITNTPEQERTASFSPDGRSIVYASERDGLWNVYQTTLTRKDDKSFLYAQEFKEEQLTNSKEACFQPFYSPDGKEIAFLESRATLRVLNLATRNIRTVLDGKYNYSYSDGDQWYKWSPDSKWFLVKYIAVGGWHNPDIALVKADGSKEMTNLTESGYSNESPYFTMDGKAMLWASDRAGYRSHGSWGAHGDAYIMFFNREAYDKFRMTKEELSLIEEEKKDEDKKSDATKTAAQKEVEPLTFELTNRKDMVVRLTPNSSSLADGYLNKKGDKFYYLTSFEKGYDLWVHDLKERSAKILAKDAGNGKIQVDSTEKNIIMIGSGQIKKIDMEKGTVTPVKINAQFEYRPEGEREYIFYHAWKQMKDKFYVTDLHGTDWDYYKTAYERFLPHINNNYDYTEMVGEMLGELNGSHTGARYSIPAHPMPTASLGAYFDNDYKGEGLLIKEIINQGPINIANTKIAAGTIITKIDGTPIAAGEDFYPLLAGKAGKKVLVAFKTSSSATEQEEWIKPITMGEQNNLLYKRWVERCRDMVDKLSGGKIGYVHIRGMNSESFREVYSELLGGRGREKEAYVVDTRHNGGGWLHDDLVTLLGGKEYQRFEPRGQYIGSDPYNKWLKPSIVLMCEDNYSNAHGFPWLYKELGVGKLVGTPVPGTMTAVWWETNIDPTIVFGVPQVAIKDMRGKYLENQELFPDIEIYNDPASVLKGKDAQLEKAVETLLQGL